MGGVYYGADWATTLLGGGEKIKTMETMTGKIQPKELLKFKEKGDRSKEWVSKKPDILPSRSSMNEYMALKQTNPVFGELGQTQQNQAGQSFPLPISWAGNLISGDNRRQTQ